MTFFRELWRRQQSEKAQNGDMSHRAEVSVGVPPEEASDITLVPLRLTTSHPTLWSESHLRAAGLRLP